MEITILILKIFATWGPSVAKMAQEIATKKDPTQADWDKLWALTQEDFDALVPKADPLAK